MKDRRKTYCSLLLSRILHLLSAVASATCLQSCHSYDSSYPTATQNEANVTNNASEYYFVMEEAEQQELLQKVSELKLRESRVDVVKRLGLPTYDRADVTKKGKFLGRSVEYYLKIWQKGLVNEKHDRFVRLEFDTSDKLMKIIQNVDDSNRTR